MNRRLASLLLLSACSLPLLAMPPQVATNANPLTGAWVPVGPDGGDARSFAADPSDAQLGTGLFVGLSAPLLAVTLALSPVGSF